MDKWKGGSGAWAWERCQHRTKINKLGAGSLLLAGLRMEEALMNWKWIPSSLYGQLLTTSAHQVLAVDLLNPSPAAEARKHKMKVRRKQQPTPSSARFSKLLTHSSLPRYYPTLTCRKTDNLLLSQTLVPTPRSFFMDVKCPGCFTITTVFSHAQTVVVCAGCSQVLCQPTGGKARLTEGCSFRRK